VEVGVGHYAVYDPVSLSVPGSFWPSAASGPGLLTGAVVENGMRRWAQMTLTMVWRVCRVVPSEPFECVQAAEPDPGLVAAELLNRLGV
jgi:hypothetical protein